MFWCCVKTGLMRGLIFQEENCPLRDANINLGTKDCGCRGTFEL